MDEHNELRTRLRAVGMELFRRDGLRFTMQQAAAMMHISKKTIYAVYPSKEALLLDMVDDAFTRSTPASSASLTATAPWLKSCGRSLSPCRRSTPRWICSR